MAGRGKIGAKAALLAAACSGLGLEAMAQTPPALPLEVAPLAAPATTTEILAAAAAETVAEPDADWGAMSLDELAGLIGARMPRPLPRPADFERQIDYGPRPRPRPAALLEGAAQSPTLTAAIDSAQAAEALPAAVPPRSGADGISAAADPAEAPNLPRFAEDAASAAAASSAQGPVTAPVSTAPDAPQATDTPAAATPAAGFAQAPISDPLAAPQIGDGPASGPVVLSNAEAAPAQTSAPETGAPEQAAPLTEPPAEPAIAQPAGPPAPAALPRLATTGFPRESYARDRSSREAVFTSAEGPAKIAAALDLAQLFTAHMLLPEARDYHDRAQGMGVQLHPELHRRWRVQRAMLDVLQGRKLSQEMPEGWEDASLWAIAGQAKPRLIAGHPDLAEAMAALQHHSEPVISRLLPELFEAALAAGDLHSADTLLRGAREMTSLAAEPVYQLMMGRLALAYDMPENAFDYFAKAADGRDIAAQRARIAMADLAIARKDPRLLPALADILSEGVNQWRYGAEGLILRARLAQVAEDLGDIPLALDIMGRIRQDHPGTAEAILAHERGALALAAFAVAVDAREIGLETYLQSLRQIESFYRLDPVWPIARSALGRAWSRAGLHAAAASEYAALQGDLQRVGAPVPPEAQAAAIPLDEAEAWLESHDQARAQIALARDGLPKFSDLGQRYAVAALKARVTGAVSTAAEFATPADLFAYAGAARAVGQQGTAHQAHRALLLQNGLSRRPDEALHAALIARDLGEPGFAAQSLEDLRRGPMGPTGAAAEPIGAALLTPMPKLAPLSQDIADVMLARSGAAITATEALLARPLLSPEEMTVWQRDRASAPAADQSQTLPRGADASPATPE